MVCDIAASHKWRVAIVAAAMSKIRPVEMLEASGGFSCARSIGMRVMQKNI
ncbi:MAG: hypothetical protein UY97_C0019G0003 [Parcubacteria group bacterium GW2011_GWB1_57_6]|nr:MAG: hypothetical protein UY93_C0002G0114 [Parcubacteria group bacterium GW2011_GWA1_56_13]KKW45557.1 MAG: hypothetical protein UY97_C0019G0003 [Parcubacteria group bacterium GW2011_GWB1_57_6]